MKTLQETAALAQTARSICEILSLKSRIVKTASYKFSEIDSKILNYLMKRGNKVMMMKSFPNVDKC